MKHRRLIRFSDAYKMGKSSTVPYIENESWELRHARRKVAALERKKEVEAWCTMFRWRLRVANEGHHWIIMTKVNKMIEWFPSSGKLVIGKNWSKGIHIHDVDQLFEVLTTCKQQEDEDESRVHNQKRK